MKASDLIKNERHHKLFVLLLFCMLWCAVGLLFENSIFVVVVVVVVSCGSCGRNAFNTFQLDKERYE